MKRYKIPDGWHPASEVPAHDKVNVMFKYGTYGYAYKSAYDVWYVVGGGLIDMIPRPGQKLTWENIAEACGIIAWQPVELPQIEEPWTHDGSDVYQYGLMRMGTRNPEEAKRICAALNQMEEDQGPKGGDND